MRYFNIRIKSKTDKKTTKKNLESLVRKPLDEIFIFPFCLFSKSFYSHLKEKRIRPFEGNVAENDFEFYIWFYYGGGPNVRTSRKIKILGKIIESNGSCLIELEFHQFLIEFIIELTLIIGFIVLFAIYMNPLFIVMTVFLIIEKCRTTLIPFLKIRSRLTDF